MRSQRFSPKAFTLVELLCVITILVLLVSMLIPVLVSARELARRAQCLANLHNISAAGMGFAAEHSGRGPGTSLITVGNYSSIAWCDILNAEYYKYYGVPRGIWRWPLPKGLLICPNAQLYQDRWYTCLYQWNTDAAGGPFRDANAGLHDNAINPDFPHESVYGLAVDPSYVQKMYNDYWGTTAYGLGWYNLGARLANFSRPDFTYLIIESEHANSTIGWVGPNSPPGPPTVVNGVQDTSYPPWGARGARSEFDFYGFRHTRPGDFSAYQQKATACFAFIDGHVDVMNANVPDQNQYERFAFDPSSGAP